MTKFHFEKGLSRVDDKKKSLSTILLEISKRFDKPQILKTELKGGTKWLKLNTHTYRNKNGEEATWDYVARETNIVTTICKSSKYNRFLIIAQPRIPIGKIVFEFPAGLMDKGDTPLEASLRELKEETGYDAEQIMGISELTVKSAGLSNESTYVSQLIVDEDKIGNSAMEVSEDIYCFWISPTEFWQLYKDLDPSLYTVDSLLFQYMLGQIRFKDVLTTKKLKIPSSKSKKRKLFTKLITSHQDNIQIYDRQSGIDEEKGYYFLANTIPKHIKESNLPVFNDWKSISSSTLSDLEKTIQNMKFLFDTEGDTSSNKEVEETFEYLRSQYEEMLNYEAEDEGEEEDKKYLYCVEFSEVNHKNVELTITDYEFEKILDNIPPSQEYTIKNCIGLNGKELILDGEDTVISEDNEQSTNFEYGHQSEETFFKILKQALRWDNYANSPQCNPIIITPKGELFIGKPIERNITPKMLWKVFVFGWE